MNSPRILLSGLVLAMTFSAPLTLDARGGPHMGGSPGNAGSEDQNGTGQPTEMFGGSGFMGGAGGDHDSYGQYQGMGQYGGAGHRGSRIFYTLDLDDSGSLTLDEFLARPADFRADRFDWLDADDDGLISEDEYLDAHGPWRDELDIDIDALHACISERMGSDWTSPPNRETHFDGMDVNGDGFVDWDEFEAAREVAVEARFNLIDTDDDGAVSLEELTEALGHRREHRGIRRDCIEEQQDINDLLDG